MSLLDKIKKNSTIKETAILAKSKFFNDKDIITTSIPGLNIALSGSLDGGFTPGLTTWAGPSKHFKTGFSLLMAKAYQEKYPDSVILFYDSEFGAPQGYFQSFGVDIENVVHTPITDIEQLKVDIMNQLKEIGRGDRVMIIIDSVGNLASRKEVEDAEAGKSVADMTRAKQIKSLFRMVTPHLTIKDIPMVVVNHTYKTLEMYAKDVVGGGTGSYYSSDNIYILGRQQEKDDDGITGYNFIINVEKSRYVKEKSKIPLSISFETGISKWSGLLDIALELGFVIKPKKGVYSRVDIETGAAIDEEWKEADTNSDEFWDYILNNPQFNEAIKQRYQLSMPTPKEVTEDDAEE